MAKTLAPQRFRAGAVLKAAEVRPYKRGRSAAAGKFVPVTAARKDGSPARGYVHGRNVRTGKFVPAAEAVKKSPASGPSPRKGKKETV